MEEDHDDKGYRANDSDALEGWLRWQETTPVTLRSRRREMLHLTEPGSGGCPSGVGDDSAAAV